MITHGPFRAAASARDAADPSAEWLDRGHILGSPEAMQAFVMQLRPVSGKPTLVNVAVQGGTAAQRQSVAGIWLCGDKQPIPNAHVPHADKDMLDNFEHWFGPRQLIDGAARRGVAGEPLIAAAIGCARVVLRFIPKATRAELAAQLDRVHAAVKLTDKASARAARAEVRRIADAATKTPTSDPQEFAVYCVYDAAKAAAEYLTDSTGDAYVSHCMEAAFTASRACEESAEAKKDVLAAVRERINILVVLRAMRDRRPST